MVDTVGRASPALAATSPAVIAWPSASAPSTAAFVAPGAVRPAERAALWLVRRGARRAALLAGCLSFVARVLEPADVRRAGGLARRRPLGAGVKRCQCFAESLDLAEQLVDALLDLLAQSVDHD